MLWAALLPDLASTEVLAGLALWCLQFTPRVTVIEASAVAMELEASARLFGGKRQLVETVRKNCTDLGVKSLSWAPSSLAAVALARAGVRNGFAKPLAQLLDVLPLDCLLAVKQHAPTLARLGCQTLGQVRALPRGGLSRRFDQELLTALDNAYGLRDEAHAWVTLPEQFSAKLELMSRVELAAALLFGARRLLAQLCAWLTARRCGVTAFTLKWCHDAMRAKSAGDGGELTVRTAEPSRNLEHLSRLLAEHLAKVQLLAAVGELELLAVQVQPFAARNASLLPESRDEGEALALVLERIAARLGPEKVLRPVLRADYRLECAVHWQSAALAQPRKMPLLQDLPQPTFVLPQPLQLAVRDECPLYQGELQLLCGPHRVETGWWQLPESPTGDASPCVERDYWVALSAHAGVLWIYQTRLTRQAPSWFLHGIFA